MENKIFKMQVTSDCDSGKIRVTPYSNRELGILPTLFNNAIQEVVEQINNEACWKKKYIHFSDNGIKYRQIDKPFDSKLCQNCVFWKNGCIHPHFMDGTKGVCEDKIYIKE